MGRPDRETDVARRLGDDVRGLGQDGIHEAAGAVAPEPRLDHARRPRGALRLEQQVHVEAVPAVGRDASGRRVRLLDEPFLLELGEDAADGGRRHTEAGGAGKRRTTAPARQTSMYSRTSAASTRLGRSMGSISTLMMGLLTTLYGIGVGPARRSLRAARSRAAARALLRISRGSMCRGLPSSTRIVAVDDRRRSRPSRARRRQASSTGRRRAAGAADRGRRR